MPSPPPPPKPPPAPPLPPYDNRLSPGKCEALFREKDGMLTQMWNKKGWRQVRNEEPCWNWGGAAQFFDATLRGDTCNSNWFEGSYQGVSASKFTGDAIAVLGFDDSIEWYCNSLYNWNGRRIDERNSTIVERNVSRAEGARRRLEATRQCADNNRNILALFGQNVHHTHAGYNQCRNLEWQMCAVMGRLPGQRSPTIVFAQAPNTLDTGGRRPLGRCGGWSPEGCGPHAYSNDDIFFLEVCTYSLVCKNRDEFFRLKDRVNFHCEIDEAGFRKLQSYVTAGKA